MEEKSNLALHILSVLSVFLKLLLEDGLRSSGFFLCHIHPVLHLRELVQIL